MAVEAVISGVMNQLGVLLFKQTEDKFDLPWGVEGKVKTLHQSFEMILAVVADAEKRKHEEEAVQLWLHRLEDVSYEMDDVLDEWNYFILKKQIEGSHGNDAASIAKKLVCSIFELVSTCFCFKQLVVHCDIAVKIKEINAKLDNIEKDKDRFGFISSSSTASNSSQEWRPVKTTAFVDESEVFGREAVKNDLIRKLLDNKTDPTIQILCLVGTGGIGKTTLAQLAYNDDRVKGHFEKRGWVCVSKPFDVIRIAKAIFESFESKSSDLNELDPLLQKISEAVSTKKFFLVFDDVWTEDETKWASLKASLKRGAPGSVILLTTRNEMVASAAGVTTQIPLGVLSESDSWLLFEKVALSGQTNHIQHEREKLKDIGRQIAEKCDGLPLALRIIGSVLRYKTKVEEWQKVVDSKLWDLKETKMKVFPHLNLSYNELSSPLKSCFSYCAVFPKDKRIEVDDLVRLWMAQGYLNTIIRSDQDEIQDCGRECFDSLAMHSFFQDFERDKFDKKIIYCKMHDIGHDFAQHLRERECLAIEEGKKVASFGNPRHVTCLNEEEEAINSVCDGRMGQIRSFFAEYHQLEAVTTTRLLNYLKRIRTLKLLQCKFEELPNEIGNLVHLRYFRLGADGITKLPQTIYKLYNLQTLHLKKCENLRELPPGIEKLRNLRHLIISNKKLKFPAGIGELTSLQTLQYLLIGSDHNKLVYLKNLNQLRESISIHISDDLDDTTDAQDANLKSKKYIKKLVFRFENSRVMKVEEAMEVLEPPPTLRELCFEYYRGSNLPTWITSCTNLVSLQLNGCIGLTSLRTLGMLSSLQKLEIYKFQQLKFMGGAFWGIRSESSTSSSSSETIFPCLMELIFVSCEEWEYWEDIIISSVEEENNQISPLLMMPCLRRLVIFACSKLRALPYRFLRKLSYLECIELDGHKLNPTKVVLVAETFAEAKGAQQSITIDIRTPQGKVTCSTLSTLFHHWKDDEELIAGVQWFLSNGVNDKQLVDLLRDPSSSVLEFTLETISSAVRQRSSRKRLIEAGVCQPLVELLRHPSPSVLILALQIVTRILETAEVMQIQCIIDHGALPCLLSLLTHNHEESIKEEVCRIISMIIRRNKDLIQAVIEAGLIAPLVNLLQTAEYDLKIAAAAAISIAASLGTHEQIKFLVSQGCIKPLCDLLVCPDPWIVELCLKGLERILKVGEDIARENHEELEDHVNPFKQLIQENGGLRNILHFKSHYHEYVREYSRFHWRVEYVREKFAKILKRYWPEVAEEEENET